MKRLVLIIVIALILGFSTLGNANNLIDRGNGLIWDPDLGITWYNFTYKGPSNTGATWDQTNAWANNLSVTVNGANITGWRLPRTVDGPYVWGNDGSTTAGYNITTSEMGHLFYTELGNTGYYDVNGNYQPGHGLVKTGPFTNLQRASYSSGTEYAADTDAAWTFYFEDGGQDLNYKVFSYYALAVHSGDVGAPVPIPGAILLFAPGLVGLAGVRRRFRK